jgi:hypothetical protein
MTPQFCKLYPNCMPFENGKCEDNIRLPGKSGFYCSVFKPSPAYFNRDLSTIHSPNTFNVERSGKGGEFVIPRTIELSVN